MIDLGILKGSSFVVLGLARSGLATGARPEGGRHRLHLLGRQRGLARCRRAGRAERRRSRGHRLVAHHRAGHQPGHSQHLSRAASRGRRGARRRQADHLRRRAAGARPGQGAVRRHHRHQRQVDDDGADRPYPAARPACAARSAAISAAARSTWRRWARAASTCWSCRPTSSNCWRPSTPMSRCGSTSRPTTSIAMAISRAMSPPRRTSSPASRSATAP